MLFRSAQRLVQPEGTKASLREMAKAAEVSVPTLRHYFQDREGAIKAGLAWMQDVGGPYLEEASIPSHPDLGESLRTFFARLLKGWRLGVGRMHATALTLALAESSVGPCYLQHMLEPMLQALEKRFAAHQALGQMSPGDPRTAAICLLSPVIIALLHQEEMGGKETRPLDVESHVQEHVRRFVAAWGPDAKPDPP